MGGRMTRTTNARIAGVTFLLYIAVGVSQMILGMATDARGAARSLSSLPGTHHGCSWM